MIKQRKGNLKRITAAALIGAIAAGAIHYGTWRNKAATEERLLEKSLGTEYARYESAVNKHLQNTKSLGNLVVVSRKHWHKKTVPENSQLIMQAIELDKREHPPGWEKLPGREEHLLTELLLAHQDESYADRLRQKNAEFYNSLEQLKQRLFAIPEVAKANSEYQESLRRETAVSRSANSFMAESRELSKLSARKPRYPFWQGLASAAGGAAVGALLVSKKRRSGNGAPKKPNQKKGWLHFLRRRQNR